ncbi:MAG: glycerophosphodiester phosphodiesterase [Acidimicrobiales bacterium]
MDPPIGFAHRGGSGAARENTIAAFSRALTLGATGLESDAWLTSDGVVVLDHDGLAGPLWRRRPFSGMPASAVPSHVPALAELYRSCGHGFELSLDVKDPAAFDAILAVARSAGAEERLWLCDGDLARLEQWRGRAGAAKLVHSTDARSLPDGPGVHARALAAAGVDALNLRERQWDADRVRQVGTTGVRAFAWGVNTTARIEALVRTGVDGIYSDDVEAMMRAIASRRPGAPHPG